MGKRDRDRSASPRYRSRHQERDKIKSSSSLQSDERGRVSHSKHSVRERDNSRSPASNKRSATSDRHEDHSPARRKRRSRSPDRQKRDRKEGSEHRVKLEPKGEPHSEVPDYRWERADNAERKQRDVKRERRALSPQPQSKSSDDIQWGGQKLADKLAQEAAEAEAEANAEPAEKPNFGLSGKLTADTNTYNGVVVKYSEPPEARKPKVRWRLYPFKGDEALPALYIHRQSAYLIGRDHKVADFPVDHPSCSKQHAVLQYRSVKYNREDGTSARQTRPYVIDLGSSNGTYLNGDRIDSARYYELHERDCLKFGFSSREYVLLHENSLQAENAGDDTPPPPPDVKKE